MLDGSAHEDFIHVAGLVQFCSYSWINMIPESIVVGIENIDRRHDFTFPSSDSLDIIDFPTSGGANEFINFIEKELQPFVNAKYRVTNHNSIIGQSLGGLLATQILLEKPDLFSTYYIVSPALWWNNRSILARSVSDINAPKEIYVAVGSEGPAMEGTALHLISTLQSLRRRELEDSLVIRYQFLEEYNHGDILHQALYIAFKLFKNARND